MEPIPANIAPGDGLPFVATNAGSQISPYAAVEIKPGGFVSPPSSSASLVAFNGSFAVEANDRGTFVVPYPSCLAAVEIPSGANVAAITKAGVVANRRYIRANENGFRILRWVVTNFTVDNPTSGATYRLALVTPEAVGGGSAPVRTFARIVSGAGLGPYTGHQQTWNGFSYVNLPGPVVIQPIWRPPSNLTAPDVSIGQVIEYWQIPGTTAFTMHAPGGMGSGQVVTQVYCSNDLLYVQYGTLRSRDQSIVNSPPVGEPPP